MRKLLIVALLCSTAAAQDCPLGSPKPIPKKGPVTPDGKRRTHKSCNTWEEISRLAPAAVTPDVAKADADLVRRKRPLLVYIYDPKDPDRYYVADWHKSWIDWQIVVATRLFDRVRIPLELAKKDPLLRAHAKRRMLILMRPDLTIVHQMSPRMSVSKLYAQFKRVVQLDFTTSVDKVWEAWQRNRKEFHAAKAALATLESHRGKAPHTNDRAEREKRLMRHLAEQGKLTQRMRDLDAAEKKLYELSPR